MANTFNLGNGNWAQKTEKLLAYNAENDNYKPLPFDFDRGSTATRVNKDGLIETVGVDEPRIDFLNNTKGHLLLEPSRQNKLPYSEDFSASSWVKTNVTITDNATTSPQGVVNASQITESASGLNLYAPSDTLVGSASAYAYSAFLKQGSLRYGGIRAIVNGFANRFFVNVDLQEGVVTDTNTTGSGVTWSYDIEDYGNGWHRVWISATNTSGNIDLAIGLSNSATPTYASGLPYYTGSGSDYIYAYGAQVEEGSYATSYIPTSGSAVTRSAETNTTQSSIPSTVIGQTEGVVYVEFKIDEAPSSTKRVIILSDGTGNERIGISMGSNILYAFIVDGGVTQVEIVKSSFTFGNYKCAFAYKNNDFAFYLNGIQVGIDTSGTVASCDRIDLGNQFGVSQIDGIIKDVKLYNTRLSNSELQALTTI